MRVLLDECIPRKLKAYLQDHDVQTVTQAGWSGIKNGQLLHLAQASFDVFLTIDKNLPHQQRLSQFNIGIMIVRTRDNRLAAFLPMIELIRSALGHIKKGQTLRVG